jgi:hypothetical protein
MKVMIKKTMESIATTIISEQFQKESKQGITDYHYNRQ